VISGDVGDHPETYTRFVSVATHTRLDRANEAWRTAFSFVTDHRPGALHRAIEPFARHGIDLVQLVSRPIPDTPWRYCFHAVLAGHPLDAEIQGALREVRAQARRLKVFGSYPASGENA
jgi:chorismate mutase/prephenate dehydratase